MNKKVVLEYLNNAMNNLNHAYHEITGSSDPRCGSVYPDIDIQTEEETYMAVLNLQKDLQNLILSLWEEKKDKQESRNQKEAIRICDHKSFWKGDFFEHTPWEQFKAYANDPVGESHYLQAELVAVHRAIYILKQLEPGQTITYGELLHRSIEYANQFPGIGAKYRDVDPRMRNLADYGVIAFFNGGPDELKTTNVRLTAKGFLAQPSEWYKEKTEEGEEIEFDEEMFTKAHKEFFKSVVD